VWLGPDEGSDVSEKPTVLIAGATGSIGGAAAAALAKRGARVVLLGRRAKKLDARAERVRGELAEAGLPSGNVEIETLVVDLADVESVRSAAAEALDRFPAIDGLVLSVGALIQGGPNILPSGHEAMFATNVMGPFLLTEQLIERLEDSDGMVLHVIAPFTEEIDWDDLQSIRRHRTMKAFNRTKVLNRMMAGELARRYAGRICSVAFLPGFVIDRSDPDLRTRWPKGLTGLMWSVMARFGAKNPATAGEPLAELMLDRERRASLNGALFDRGKPVDKPDEAMSDAASGAKLRERLEALTGMQPE
jgi:NAD(P)-dependent dehydrogenase (short-subunit alcohol dehydrogenase family)